MIALTLASLVLAPAPAQDRSPPQRIRNAQVYGEDPCPKGEADEIVVCKRLPEEERFRMPERFRVPTPKAGNTAWTRRAETIDEQSRIAGGLPDTCSVVGTGGQTGCTAAMLRAWAAEKREAERTTP